jgi:hypothetical protein
LQEAEQILVVDGFLAVGEFGEANVDFVELVALEWVAEFFETIGEGTTARPSTESLIQGGGLEEKSVSHCDGRDISDRM